MNRYRCTRELPYSATTCAGHNDLTAREGTYLHADSREEAIQMMAVKFPMDCMRNRAEDVFTADEVKSPRVYNSLLMHDFVNSRR